MPQSLVDDLVSVVQAAGADGGGGGDPAALVAKSQGLFAEAISDFLDERECGGNGRPEEEVGAAAIPAAAAAAQQQVGGGAPQQPADASSAATREIILDTLKSLFHLPIIEAAKRLGISRTSLKAVCRKHGVARWPKRALDRENRLLAAQQQQATQQQARQQQQATRGAPAAKPRRAPAQPSCPLVGGAAAAAAADELKTEAHHLTPAAAAVTAGGARRSLAGALSRGATPVPADSAFAEEVKPDEARAVGPLQPHAHDPSAAVKAAAIAELLPLLNQQQPHHLPQHAYPHLHTPTDGHRSPTLFGAPAAAAAGAAALLHHHGVSGPHRPTPMFGVPQVARDAGAAAAAVPGSFVGLSAPGGMSSPSLWVRPQPRSGGWGGTAPASAAGRAPSPSGRSTPTPADDVERAAVEALAQALAKQPQAASRQQRQQRGMSPLSTPSTVAVAAAGAAAPGAAAGFVPSHFGGPAPAAAGAARACAAPQAAAQLSLHPFTGAAPLVGRAHPPDFSRPSPHLFPPPQHHAEFSSPLAGLLSSPPPAGGGWGDAAVPREVELLRRADKPPPVSLPFRLPPSRCLTAYMHIALISNTRLPSDDSPTTAMCMPADFGMMSCTP